MDLRITADNSPLQRPLTSASEIDDKIRAEVENAIKHTAERITTIDDKIRELVDIRTGLSRHLEALLAWNAPAIIDQRLTEATPRLIPTAELLEEAEPIHCGDYAPHGPHHGTRWHLGGAPNAVTLCPGTLSPAPDDTTLLAHCEGCHRAITVRRHGQTLCPCGTTHTNVPA